MTIHSVMTLTVISPVTIERPNLTKGGSSYEIKKECKESAPSNIICQP